MIEKKVAAAEEIAVDVALARAKSRNARSLLCSRTLLTPTSIGQKTVPSSAVVLVSCRDAAAVWRATRVLPRLATALERYLARQPG